MRITLGQYLPGESMVHRLDPRVKLFLMGLMIGVVFRLHSPLALLASLLVCVAATRLSALPFTRLVSGLAPFIWLFVFTAVLHVFMTPGHPIAWLPGATHEGLHGGLQVGVQLIAAIWTSTLLTLTTSPLDLVWAMEWYLKPLAYLKVPIDEIALMVMLALRFVPILFEETDRIIKAQKARGVDLDSGSIVTKVRSLVPIIVPLLHGVFRRADDLAVALSLRGYEPGQPRSHYRAVSFGRSDLLGLCCASLLIISFLWL